MSTLNGLIWSRCDIAPTYSLMPHFQRTLIRERWDRVRPNVQKKKENENTGKGENENAGKGEAGEKTSRPILERLECCPSVVVRRAERNKEREIQCFKSGLVSVSRGGLIHLMIVESLFTASLHFCLLVASFFFSPIS